MSHMVQNRLIDIYKLAVLQWWPWIIKIHHEKCHALIISKEEEKNQYNPFSEKKRKHLQHIDRGKSIKYPAVQALYQHSDIHRFEMIQRRTARYASNIYHTNTSVSNMICFWCVSIWRIRPLQQIFIVFFIACKQIIDYIWKNISMIFIYYMYID